MTLAIGDVAGLRAVRLPALNLAIKTPSAMVTQVAFGGGRVEGGFNSKISWQGIVKELTCHTADGDLIITQGKKAAPDRDAPMHLIAEAIAGHGDTLILTGAVTWIKHPRLVADPRINHAVTLDSWRAGLKWAEERRNGEGNIVSPGLRTPQVGALHALAAHWTVQASPALVVMPTGTGKTEVMIACMVMKAMPRLLVLVPSDALRTQTARKFSTLGVLTEAGVVSGSYRLPIVATLTSPARTEDDRRALRGVNPSFHFGAVW